MNHITELETRDTLERLHSQLAAQFAAEIERAPGDWQTFVLRLDAHFPRLFRTLLAVYGPQHEFMRCVDELAALMAQEWFRRPAGLKELDAAREPNPLWFQSNQMLGGVCYVDLYAGDLTGIRSKIPYFKELGLTYLHLMPLFKMPEKANDGGYAVSSYREVHPPLGTLEQLQVLASELRAEGISLVLDLVFNHTSDEHTWALQAKAGDTQAQSFFRMFPDRTLPDAYEKTLREIFPDEHPGAFTFFEEPGQWVWTTFHSYQWDLNYANCEVFLRMAQEMLALANAGAQVLRLDAVAFIWKQLGTSCENLPQAHLLIQAFNAVARIAAPGLLFKSEAIVHPDDVVKYIDTNECQLSYNPLVMALLWNSLATHKTRLLTQALRERYEIPSDCAWVNYVRCHDDIGWTFSDEDAGQLGINAYQHRKFLNEFYTGRFPGSFARGLPFQENPATGDCRISGTCASLAGLEEALSGGAEYAVELAIRRILLIHSVILSLGGIPLLYLGDEVGVLNDYSYREQPGKLDDSRWVHRPQMDWEQMARRTDPSTPEGRVFQGLRHLIALRKEYSALGVGTLRVLELDNVHVLGYARGADDDGLLVLANFSETIQTIRRHDLKWVGATFPLMDRVSGKSFDGDVKLEPYQFVWIGSDPMERGGKD